MAVKAAFVHKGVEGAGRERAQVGGIGGEELRPQVDFGRECGRVGAHEGDGGWAEVDADKPSELARRTSLCDVEEEGRNAAPEIE